VTASPFQPSARAMLLGIAALLSVGSLLCFYFDEEHVFVVVFAIASVAYWLLLSGAPKRIRFLAVSSPLLYSIGLAYASFVAMQVHASTTLHPLMWPFYVMFLAGLIAAIITIVKIRPDQLNFLQLILIPGGGLMFLYGSMTLLGDWL